MRAKLKGKITEMYRTDDSVRVQLKFDGKADSKSVDARKASMTATLLLKTLVADELKLGSTITVLITDEETPQIE